MSDQFKEFTALKQSMDQFSNDIQEALELQRANVRRLDKEIISKATELRKERALLQEKYSNTSKLLESLKKEVIEANLSNEDSKKTYDEYQIRRKKLLQVGQKLRKENDELKELNEKQNQIITDFRERLHQQANKDNSEVTMYEQLLGITVDSSATGALSFTFTNFDEMNPSAKCTMTLDVSGPSFEITKVVPEISSDIQQTLLEALNEENNLPLFIVRARETLIEHFN